MQLPFNTENVDTVDTSSMPTSTIPNQIQNSQLFTLSTKNNTVEVTKILHTIYKWSGATLIFKLINHLNYPSFIRENFVNSIKSATDCKNIQKKKSLIVLTKEQVES